MGGHFYKIIVSPSTQSHTLRIPEKYVKKYKETQLAKDYVKLRVADCRVWRVELFKECDFKVWLTKGWELFANTYSLNLGHFLLFGYDEPTSQFHVTIFNTSGFEIDYDQVFPNRIDQLETSSSSSDDSKVSPDAKEIHTIDDEVETSIMHSIEAFKFQKPHFKLVMHYNNVSNQYRSSFPINHVRAHLTGESKKMKLILKRSVDEKSYDLRLNVYTRNHHAQVGYNGWRNFVLDNELCVGDACIFELVDPNTLTYKVTIFRKSLVT